MVSFVGLLRLLFNSLSYSLNGSVFSVGLSGLHGSLTGIPMKPAENQSRRSSKDRATYQGAIDLADRAKVRSAVDLTIDAVWVMDVVDATGGCWDGALDRCTYPTGPSPSSPPPPFQNHPRSPASSSAGPLAASCLAKTSPQVMLD